MHARSHSHISRRPRRAALDDPRRKVLRVRVSEHERAVTEQLAQAAGVSVSEFVRQLIHEAARRMRDEQRATWAQDRACAEGEA